MEQTPFDHLVSSQDLQMLKLLIPYTPPANQQFLAVYVKFMELSRTFSLFQPYGRNIHMQAFKKDISSPFDMINELKPYLPEENAESFDMILNMMSMMEMFSADSENMPDMSDLFQNMFTAQTMKGNDDNEYGCMDESPVNEEYGPPEDGID